jgi:membrane complex biogenesis BtpA family protein
MDLRSLVRDRRPAVIGVIHVGALPGTPRAAESLAALERRACEEAAAYRAGGVDALMVENMHDVPYLRGGVGPEIVAGMTRLAQAVRAGVDMPVGVQILAAANREAIAVALAAELEFVRVEGFVYAHVADEGLIQGCAGELLRYRRAIGAEHVAVIADIKKKHASHSITADVDIVETARAAAFFGAAGVIVTGISTGCAADVAELRAVKQGVPLPVFVGSGVTRENLADYAIADGLIVGSHFKQEGRWDATVDERRVQAFMEAVARGRQS